MTQPVPFRNNLTTLSNYGIFQTISILKRVADGYNIRTRQSQESKRGQKWQIILIFANFVVLLRLIMTLTTAILDYGAHEQKPFKRADVMTALSSKFEFSGESLKRVLSRLVSEGRLQRVGYGLYKASNNRLPIFSYEPSPEETELYQKLKRKFPFTDICIWRPEVLVPFMHHVPIVTATFIDVERVAMDSVFSALQSMEMKRPILINPSKTEVDRIIPSSAPIIVRPLVQETPTENINGIIVPTIEKILVDAVSDKELQFAQGAELFAIYENAFERFDINRSRLLRYASRRNRKQKVETILKSNNYDTSR